MNVSFLFVLAHFVFCSQCSIDFTSFILFLLQLKVQYSIHLFKNENKKKRKINVFIIAWISRYTDFDCLLNHVMNIFLLLLFRYICNNICLKKIFFVLVDFTSVWSIAWCCSIICAEHLFLHKITKFWMESRLEKMVRESKNSQIDSIFPRFSINHKKCTTIEVNCYSVSWIVCTYIHCAYSILPLASSSALKQNKMMTKEC